MRSRLLPLVVLAAAACGSAPDDPKPHSPTPSDPAPQDPAQRGYARARRDIAAGHVRLRTSGFPCADNSWLDPESGLVRVTDGCVSDADADAARAAYNAEMRRAAAAGEVERFVFLDRVRTQEQVEATLAGAARIEAGATVSLLDGRYRAELGPRYQPSGKNSVVQCHLRVYEGASAAPRIEMNTRDAVSVALDPDGATLVVGDGTRVTTFDLSTGTGLQRFDVPR